MTNIQAIDAAVKGLEARLQKEIDQTGADLDNIQSKLNALSAMLHEQGGARAKLADEQKGAMERLCERQAAELVTFLEDLNGAVRASLEGHAKTTHAAITGGE